MTVRKGSLFQAFSFSRFTGKRGNEHFGESLNCNAKKRNGYLFLTFFNIDREIFEFMGSISDHVSLDLFYDRLNIN